MLQTKQTGEHIEQQPEQRPEQKWTDFQVEEIVGNLLRIGVSLAAIVVVVGGLIYLIHFGTLAPDYRVFRGEPSDFRHPSGIISEALSFSGRGLIQLGLLLLVATPVARVVFSVFAFAKERDWIYVVITLIVLSVLTFSLFGGQL